MNISLKSYVNVRKRQFFFFFVWETVKANLGLMMKRKTEVWDFPVISVFDISPQINLMAASKL